MLYFVMVLMTPSHMVLNSMKVKVKPESFFLASGTRRSPQGQGQESGGGGDQMDGNQVGPFFLERLQKPSSGINNVGRIDSHAPLGM
jgi:hypothetical protein